MFSSLSVITLVPYQLNRLCVCACVCNFCDKAVGNGTFDTKRMLQFSSVKCTLWLKFGFRVVLPSRPVPSSPIQLKKEKGNGTILIMFAKGCSCISDPSVCRQQRVCSNFITKPSSTEENRCFTEDDERRGWSIISAQSTLLFCLLLWQSPKRSYCRRETGVSSCGLQVADPSVPVGLGRWPQPAGFGALPGS